MDQVFVLHNMNEWAGCASLLAFYFLPPAEAIRSDVIQARSPKLGVPVLSRSIGFRWRCETGAVILVWQKFECYTKAVHVLFMLSPDE